MKLQPNEWVTSAINGCVVSIGQLSPADTRALNSAVKKGTLKKGKGGRFPMIKTVYCAPSFDIEADRLEGEKEFRKCAALGDLARRIRNIR